MVRAGPAGPYKQDIRGLGCEVHVPRVHRLPDVLGATVSRPSESAGNFHESESRAKCSTSGERRRVLARARPRGHHDTKWPNDLAWTCGLTPRRKEGKCRLARCIFSGRPRIRTSWLSLREGGPSCRGRRGRQVVGLVWLARALPGEDAFARRARRQRAGMARRRSSGRSRWPARSCPASHVASSTGVLILARHCRWR